jgi:proton-dependent oligopeptide transporter, POT family
MDEMNPVQTEPGTTVSTDKGFFGHPRLLANLFTVEMWERFSFYGMQGILAYYMYYTATDGGLGLDKALSLSLVGAYGGGVYLSTILGAWLADRLLGSERVLFFSACVIMAGHVALALLPGVVGTLYSEKDDRRDAGFSLFYMGVNLGGLLGPLVTGFLQSRAGFHWGFGAAAVGMALGLIVYSLKRKDMPESAHHVANPLAPGERKKYALIFGAVVVLIVSLLLTHLVTAQNLATWMAYVAIGASVAYFLILLGSSKTQPVERKRVFAFIPLYIASAAFWALFQQQFTFIAVYSDEKLDRHLFGWEMPAAWVQSINPVFIVIFAGVLAALWTRLGEKQPSSPVKFSLGLVLMGLAFLAFLPLAGSEKTPLLALVGILLLFTLAELCLSPIGLSVSTKLAPAAFQAQMVALFFLSVSLGTTLAGILAGYYDPSNETPYFLGVGSVAVVLGLALLGSAPAIRKLMSGVR